MGGDYRGGIRHQIGVPWKGAPQEIRSDYLQKPLPTGKISGQARSAKKEPHRGAPTETSNQSLDPVGHTSVHLQACPTTQLCSLVQPSWLRPISGLEASGELAQLIEGPLEL